MVAAQYQSSHISTNPTIAITVQAFISTLKVVLFRIPTGSVGEDIIDYVPARARKRIEHEGAQARRHSANFKGYSDVFGQSAGIDAGIISVKSDGNLGSICTD